MNTLNIPIDPTQVSSHLSSAFSIVDTIERYNETINKGNLIYMLLYLECQTNIRYIDCLNLNNCPQDDPDVKSMINLLEWEALATFFANESAVKTLPRKMMKTLQFKSEFEENNLIVLCYVKIKTLKAIVNLEKGGEALKNLRFATRLRNLRNALLNLSEVLRESPELRSYKIGVPEL